MIRRILVVILFSLVLLSAGAQDNELERLLEDEDLEYLIDEALQLEITATVLPPDEQPVWNSQSKKLTIPGRSVAVRLEN